MRYADLMALSLRTPLIETQTLAALGADRRPLAVQLSRWVRAGKLLQLRRGLYMMPRELRPREPLPMFVANVLLAPSYVSLECALAFHGLIPEQTAAVQSLTSRRSATYRTPEATFVYHRVRPAWLFGYREESMGGGAALVATPEKALLDLAYVSGPLSAERLEEMRLQDLERIDVALLHEMASRGGSPRMERAARLIATAVEREAKAWVSL